MPLLNRLVQQGQITRVVAPNQNLKGALEDNWRPGITRLIVVGAIGAMTRLIAPLIRGKELDPAVLVLHPRGDFIIPLLGGHAGGAEQRAHELAGLLGGQAVITGACAHDGRIPLDAFGEGWGWTRSGPVEQWRQLMTRYAGGATIAAFIKSADALRSGTTLRSSCSDWTSEADQADLGISSKVWNGCQWHPAHALDRGGMRAQHQPVLDRTSDCRCAVQFRASGGSRRWSHQCRPQSR